MLRMQNMNTYAQYLDKPQQEGQPISLNLNHNRNEQPRDELGDAFSNLDKLLAAGR